MIFNKFRRKPLEIAIFVAAFALALVPSVDGGQVSTAGMKLPAEFMTRTDLSEKDRRRVTEITALATDFSSAEKFEAMSGGAATSTRPVNRDSFSDFSANLTFEQEQDFRLGNALFRKLWVSSPASTLASDGLGPFFNARACQSCHIKDGRGHPPQGDRDATSMVLRLAREPVTAEERRMLERYIVPNFPDPVYGSQFQDLAVPGLKAEGKFTIRYTEFPVVLRDGTQVMLRKPDYALTGLAYGPLQSSTSVSPRIAPPMSGMGLIQAIHPADLVAASDPEDRNGDGISGRLQLVREKEGGRLKIGRFGWKAEQASIKMQSAAAFAADIGISTTLVPAHHGDCTARQEDCLSMPTGAQQKYGDTEAPPPVLDLVTFYSENLAVPIRRNVANANVLKGKALFYSAGCATCHRPKYVTRRDAENKAHAFQLIWPYSDFLLHDMGEGLADGQRVGRASGREWRTPPLWGIGLTETVSGHTFFLHDGRARNLAEAILWHGGEAEKARNNFADMAASEREALLAFLESL
jgi:CxxC motif-containing protein (DUF1111 family)